MRLLLQSALALALAASPSVGAQRPPASIAEQYLLAAANADRSARNLPLLQRDPILARAALTHCQQMAAHATISHQFNGEPDLAARGSSAGARFSLITENVAEAPAAVMIHDLWMNSAGHRANLLDPNVNAVGIAIVVRDRQIYAVEDFARTVQTLSLAQQEIAVAGVLARPGIVIADTTQDARRTCAMPTGYVGARQPGFVMRYTASDLGSLPEALTTRLASGRYHQAIVAACAPSAAGSFTNYSLAVLLYP